MTIDRRYVRLREQGRRLASERDDLIAAGIDPTTLEIPLHPLEPRRTGRHAAAPNPYDDAPLLEADFARVWLLVAVACSAAFLGCIATAGAMLVVTQEPTWHAWVAAIAGLGWAAGAVAAARVARRLYHQARDGGAQ